MNGVVELDLGQVLEDPEAVVRAAVSDQAGNRTVVERTIAWLLAPGGGLLFSSGFEGGAVL